MNWQRLREKILEKYYPTEEEFTKIQEQYSEISSYIEDEYGLETHFAGSASRKTCVSGDQDLDIFILFPEEIDRTELENKGLRIGKKVFEKFNGEYEVEYAEHPYTKGEIKNFEVEIVPCHDAPADSIKSSVDRTPHHSRWLQENLNQEQREDVVILKRFLESAEIYGSSLKTQGFSGYLCEILINQHGDFRSLIHSTTDWGEKTVIDPENHHEDGLPEKLEDRFSEDSLVVIDPVDPERNVASVLSTENYAKFIYHCWKFRKDPGMDFFQEEEREFTEFELQQEIEDRGELLVLSFEKPEEVDDVVYPQMRKTLGRIEAELEDSEFRIYTSGFHVAETTRIFLELDRKLPEIGEMQGPKVTHGDEHIAQFTSKYDKVYIEDDRLYAKVEREYSDARKLLKDFLNGDTEELKKRGIPGNVAEQMQEYSFEGPLEGGKKWLNHLGKQLHVKNNG